MTQLRFKVKKGDTVKVLTGKEKGKTGVVQKIDLQNAKIVVEGVNTVTRHIRPSQMHPSGSFTKNLPLHISNVGLVDPSTNEAGKVGYKTLEDGSKVRYFKKSGHVLETSK